MYYKVVTSDLKSLGLRKNPTILTFPEGVWVKEKSPSIGKNDSGGIWVANGYGQANTLKKYMKKKYNLNCRIFSVEIGDVLYENSYRTKTDKVLLCHEVK